MGNFKIYKSSAGSGKTFTLVAEFLALALQENDSARYRKMLAITFTNKAAAEMRERIIEKLRLFADNVQSDDMLKMVVEKTRLDSTEISRRSADMLSDILHNYSFLSIGTIDNFSHRIIRAFSRDLKIPQDFEIELNVSELNEKAIDRVLSKAGRDEKLTEQLIELVVYKLDDDKNYNLSRTLADTAGLLNNENAIEQLELLKTKTPEDFKEVKNLMQQSSAKHKNVIIQIGEKAQALISDNNISTSSLAGGSKSGIAKYFEYLAFYRVGKFEPTKSTSTNIDSDKWYSTKCTIDQKSAIDSISSELKELFYKATNYIEKHLEEIILFERITPQLYELSLLLEIEKARNDLKEELNILPISEFNRLIAGVVKDEPAPFIYERIGERFSNIFIDEFQDTSRLQWGNFLPLIDESLSNNNFNMLVGDAKQSIYRWRGGEAEQFIELPALAGSDANILTAQREGNLKNNFEAAQLASNYRSCQTIVNFNNDFFKCFAEKLQSPYKEIYDDASQLSHSVDDGGYVTFKIFEKADLEKEKHEDDPVLIELLKQIEDAKNDGFPLSDMAILVRTAKFGQKAGIYLSENNIPVITSDSLLIDTSNMVKLMIALFRYISNNDNQTAAVEIIKGFHQLESPKADLTRTINSFRKNTRAKLNINAFLKANGKPEIPKDIQSLSVYELAETLLSLYLAEFRENAYIKTFLNFVFISSKKAGTAIETFLKSWDALEKKPSLQLNEQMNAVKILTIHRSKGLEFPIVFLPDLCWRPHNGDLLWIKPPASIKDKLPVALVKSNNILEKTSAKNVMESEKVKEEFDEANLVYVASTRARTRLYGILKTANSISKKIYECLSILEGFDEANKEFKRGKKDTVVNKNKADQENLKRIVYKSAGRNWRNKISISSQAPENWDATNLAQAYTYGAQLHEIMAEIEDINKIEDLIKKKTEKGILDQSSSTEIQNKILSFFKIPEVKEWFDGSAQVMAERELKDNLGKFYRPDRVLIKNKNATIIDYKTGEENPNHHLQVQNYMNILQSMNYENVEGFLLYTDSEKVISVAQEEGKQLSIF